MKKTLLFMLSLFFMGGFVSASTLSTDQITWLYDNGLTKYTTLEQFRVNDYFTREQAAKFYSQFAINVFKKELDTSLPCIFTDIDSADQTLKSDIITSCQLGIFKGTKGKFDPKRVINSVEATAVLMRILFGMSDETVQPWYQNYIMKAGALGILPTTLGSTIDRGTIAHMIYLSRSGNFFDINKAVSDGAKISYNELFSFYVSNQYLNNSNSPIFTETDKNVYIRLFFSPSNNLAILYPRLLQYNKGSNTITILDTAGTTTHLISDTYRAYNKGYCRESCTMDYTDVLYVENTITKQKISIPSARAISIDDNTKKLTYDEVGLYWKKEGMINGLSTCSDPDNTMVGLGVKCLGGYLYTQYSSKIQKSIDLP